MQKANREIQNQPVTTPKQPIALEDSQNLRQDMASDVILTDDQGERIAAMREYVFLNLASGN